MMQKNIHILKEYEDFINIHIIQPKQPKFSITSRNPHQGLNYIDTNYKFT